MRQHDDIDPMGEEEPEDRLLREAEAGRARPRAHAGLLVVLAVIAVLLVTFGWCLL